MNFKWIDALKGNVNFLNPLIKRDVNFGNVMLNNDPTCDFDNMIIKECDTWEDIESFHKGYNCPNSILNNIKMAYNAIQDAMKTTYPLLDGTEIHFAKTNMRLSALRQTIKYSMEECIEAFNSDFLHHDIGQRANIYGLCFDINFER